MVWLPARGSVVHPLAVGRYVVAHYYRELLHFLTRSVKDRDTAADLAQESFARIYAAEQAGQAIRDPRALLYRTARNLVTDHHRRGAVRAQAGEVAHGGELAEADACAAPAAFEPEVALSSGQGLAAMLATIEALPPRCREAFILYKFDGLSYAEVDLLASYTYLDATVTRSNDAQELGKRPFQTARSTAKLRLGYALPGEALRGWSLGLGLRRVGSTVADTYNRYWNEGYTLADAALHYAKGPMRFSLNVANLGNKITTANRAQFYGQGRSVMATVGYRW